MRHGPHSGHPDDCFGCRVKTVQISPQPFQAHWNYTVGNWVTNERDFRDQLSRLGDRQSERTGISSTYEAIHPADLRASPPPESPPDHLRRLSDIDDPALAARVAEARSDAKIRATHDARTSNVIPKDDD